MEHLNETAKNVIEALKPVADKIGEGAAHLYQVYTQQMFAEGIGNLILTGIFVVLDIVLVAAFFKFLNRVLAEKAEEGWAEDCAHFLHTLITGVIGGTLSLVLLMVIPATLVDNITKIANPEYHAINRLFEQVKGK